MKQAASAAGPKPGRTSFTPKLGAAFKPIPSLYLPEYPDKLRRKTLFEFPPIVHCYRIGRFERVCCFRKPLRNGQSCRNCVSSCEVIPPHTAPFVKCGRGMSAPTREARSELGGIARREMVKKHLVQCV